MVRLVLAEEKLKLILCRPLPPGIVRVGLLVGKATESRDIVVQAVPTPSLKEFGASADKGKKSVADDDVESFSDWWVVEHASQVCAMLPGGLDVVGVFVSYPSLALPAFLPRITKLLRDIVANQDIYNYPTHNYHQLLLQYCQHVRKFKCQRLDAGDTEAEFKPVELKFREQQEVWVRLHAVLSVDTQCYVPTTSPHQREKGMEGGSQSRLKQVQQGVAPLLKSIQAALVTLHGDVVQHGDGPLIKKGRGPSHRQASIDVVSAILYLRQTYVTGSPPIFLPNARQVLLRGCLVLTAYVHEKATCADAIAAVKQDAYRTITARLQIMLEEDSAQGCVVSSQTGVFLQKLPQRVSLFVPTWNQFMLTEYLLPREELQDCYSKAAELLGVQEELVRVKHLEKLTQLKAEVDEDTKENGNCMEVVRQDKKPMVEKITRDKPLNNEDNYDGIWKVDSRIASVLAAILGVLFVFALYKFNKLV